MLETLPRDEYINGIAELVKTACLDNSGLYRFVQDNKEKILSMEMNTVSEAIYRCVKYKAAVVEADEKENDLRRVLNLGHTVGHAIEKVKSVKHGFAVAAGMGLALDLSVEMGDAEKAAAEEIKSLLEFFGLPGGIKGIINKDDIPAIMDAIESDKKRESHSVNFVLLKDPGKSFIKSVDFTDISDLISGILSGHGGCR
jgi:3-dehydroquinate synthase